MVWVVSFADPVPDVMRSLVLPWRHQKWGEWSGL